MEVLRFGICLGLAGDVALSQEVLPSFDVVSVKASTTAISGFGKERIIARPGSLIMSNVRFRSILKWAFGLQECQINGPDSLGRPGWMGGDLQRYEIIAKGPADAPVPQLKLMLQKMLVERFDLAVHRETKELQTYSLLEAKSGHKFHASSDSDLEEGPVAVSGSERRTAMAFQRISMTQFAELLSGPLGLPVLDQTGLAGRFDVTLDYAAYGNLSTKDEYESATLDALQKQLGLKLEKQNNKVEILVVDRAEKMPSHN